MLPGAGDDADTATPGSEYTRDRHKWLGEPTLDESELKKPA